MIIDNLNIASANHRVGYISNVTGPSTGSSRCSVQCTEHLLDPVNTAPLYTDNSTVFSAKLAQHGKSENSSNSFLKAF